jgi:hypothetical protein
VRKPIQSEELALACYGVEVRVVDAAGLGLCQRLRDTLPPEFVAPSEPTEAVVTYVVTAGVLPETAEPPEHLISCNGEAVFATAMEEELFAWLRHDIDDTVARRSSQLVFVHAGVVGWRGVAIVIPGRRSIGKSMLVAELVRLGAVYYSDTFAVLDETGLVHPYRGTIELRDGEEPQDLRLVQEDVPAEALSIGLIVAGAFQPGGAWRPTIVRGAHATLPLIDSTVRARDEANRMSEIAPRIARSAVALRGPRPEAAEVAAQLLDLVDDALVSHALDAVAEGSRHLTDDLARVADIRLRSQIGRPASPPRRRVAARYVRFEDFLSPAGHQRLLDHVLASEDDFHESGIVGPEGGGKVDYGARKSRSLAGAGVEEIWDLFDRPLRAVLPAVRRQLGIPWFPLGEVERQLTAHGSGDFFVPHVDTGHPIVASRRISCVYYLHASPRHFRGGELKLYDTWVTPTGSTGAGTYTSLIPVDNTIVFFPSDAFHEVCPVYPETDAFGDSRFALTVWFREGAWPAGTDDAEPPS